MAAAMDGLATRRAACERVLSTVEAEVAAVASATRQQAKAELIALTAAAKLLEEASDGTREEAAEAESPPKSAAAATGAAPRPFVGLPSSSPPPAPHFSPSAILPWVVPPPPPPPPVGERRRAWEAHARRRQHDATMVVGMLGRAARHAEGAWAEVSIGRNAQHDALPSSQLIDFASPASPSQPPSPAFSSQVKAVALFSPHGRVLSRPVDARWLETVASSVGLDVGVGGSDYILLPLIVELSRAPLPIGWCDAASFSATTDVASSATTAAFNIAASSAASNAAAAPSYRHVHAPTGEVVSGHPLQSHDVFGRIPPTRTSLMSERVDGMIVRARRTLRPKMFDSWVQASPPLQTLS